MATKPAKSTKATPRGAFKSQRERNVQSWRREAWELLSEIERMDVEPAADVVRRIDPSPEVIACLAFFYEEWKSRAKQSHNAKLRHENDPKQIDKERVFDQWTKWQAAPSTHKNKTAFANAMLDKYARLSSVKVICDWCRKWERAR